MKMFDDDINVNFVGHIIYFATRKWITKQLQSELVFSFELVIWLNIFLSVETKMIYWAIKMRITEQIHNKVNPLE